MAKIPVVLDCFIELNLAPSLYWLVSSSKPILDLAASLLTRAFLSAFTRVSEVSPWNPV